VVVADEVVLAVGRPYVAGRHPVATSVLESVVTLAALHTSGPSAAREVLLAPVRVKPSPPRLAGGPALGAREEVLERNVQERGARLGEHGIALAKLPVDVDAAAAAARDPRRESQLAVDEHRSPEADEDPCRHGREVVPGGEEPAGLVKCGGNESSMHDPGAGLMPFAEAESRVVPSEPCRLGEREMKPVGVVPAPPARGVVVRRYVYRSPPRSKCAR
jgi:hypothetical protein